jgi:cell division protein FtsL
MTRFAITWIAAVVAAAIGLFYVSDQVEGLEDELAREEQAILQHQEAIHVLQAEWTYLNRPERIADLAQRYLALAPLSADRVVGIQDLPQRPEPGEDPSAPGLPSLKASLGATAGTVLPTLTSTGSNQ